MGEGQIDARAEFVAMVWKRAPWSAKRSVVSAVSG
jgi:hypothetical protein